MNNAGYSLVGTIEEAGADEVRALYETNIFGALSIIQARLCPCCESKAGAYPRRIERAWSCDDPIDRYYCSSKWAFEAIHESLATEIKPFGIKVTIIEPGAYATEFGSPSSLKLAAALDIYADLRNQVYERIKTMERGDPNATYRRLSSKLWMRRIRRSVSFSGVKICLGCAPHTPSAWRPGKNGSPSPTQPKANQ